MKRSRGLPSDETPNEDMVEETSTSGSASRRPRAGDNLVSICSDRLPYCWLMKRPFVPRAVPRQGLNSHESSAACFVSFAFDAYRTFAHDLACVILRMLYTAVRLMTITSTGISYQRLLRRIKSVKFSCKIAAK